MAVKLEDIQEYARKLPANPHTPVYHVAVRPEMPVGRLTTEEWLQPLHVARLTFKAERIKIDGVNATAWYYHDALVKVAV